MILSTNVIDKENDDNDSSSDSSIKDEGLAELKNIMNNNKKSNSKINNFNIFFIDGNDLQKNNVNILKNENSLAQEDYSNNLSKIEFKNMSINSSFKSLSRGEDFIQKDILQVLNCQNNVSIYII